MSARKSLSIFSMPMSSWYSFFQIAAILFALLFSTLSGRASDELSFPMNSFLTVFFMSRADKRSLFKFLLMQFKNCCRIFIVKGFFIDALSGLLVCGFNIYENRQSKTKNLFYFFSFFLFIIK